MGKSVRVKKGTEVLEIDSQDLPFAVKDGYLPTERLIVSNPKTKESFEIDPTDYQDALNDGFSFQDIVGEKKKSGASFGAFGDLLFRAVSVGAKAKAVAEQDKKPIAVDDVKQFGNKVKSEAATRLQNQGLSGEIISGLGDEAVAQRAIDAQEEYTFNALKEDFRKLSQAPLVSDETRAKINLPTLPENIEEPKSSQQKAEENIIKQQQESKKRRMDIAILHGAEIAKQNPLASPDEIGAQVLKLADPDTYKIWEKTGFQNRNTKSQAAELGIQALAATGDDNAAALVAKDIETFDERFPERKIAMVRQKIAAKAYEEGNAAGGVLGNIWSVAKMDRLSKDLSPEDKKVYDQYIKPEEEKLGMFSTNMPNWGLAKFGEGAATVAEDAGSFLTGGKTEEETANAILNAGTETRYQDVGDSPVLEQRKKELQRKKQDGQMDAKDFYELDEINKTINSRGAAQRFFDGTARVTGNVAAFAVLGRSVGSLLEAVASRAGLVASEIGTAAKGIEGIGETAANIGMKAATVQKYANTIGLLATGYAASDNGNAQQALQLFPDDKDADKRTVYKQMMNWVTAASELVFNDVKVLDAAKKIVSPKIVNLASELSRGTLSRAAAKANLKGIFDEVAKLGSATAKNINQEGVEELMPIVADAAFTGLFAPEKSDIGKTVEQAWDTYTSMLIEGAFVGAIGGVADYRQNRIALPMMARLGRTGFGDYTESVKTEIARQEVTGQISPEKAQEKRKLIDDFTTANQIVDNVPKLKTMPEKARNKYVAMLVNEGRLQDEAAQMAQADPVAAETIVEEVKQSQQERADLVNGKKVVTDDGGIVPLAEAEPAKVEPVVKPRRALRATPNILEGVVAPPSKAKAEQNTLDDKKADIEKRRKEELESTDMYQYDKKFKEFQKYGKTVKEAFDNLFEQSKNNPENKELSNLIDYIIERLIPEDIRQDSDKNTLVQEYIDDNKVNIDKANKSTKSRQAKINAKYDEELKALETPPKVDAKQEEVKVEGPLSLLNKRVTVDIEGEQITGEFYRENDNTLVVEDDFGNVYELGKNDKLDYSNIKESSRETFRYISPSGELRVGDNVYTEPKVVRNDDNSFTITTKEGKQFGGQTAENIAYELALQELDSITEQEALAIEARITTMADVQQIIDQNERRKQGTKRKGTAKETAQKSITNVNAQPQKFTAEEQAEYDKLIAEEEDAKAAQELVYETLNEPDSGVVEYKPKGFDAPLQYVVQQRKDGTLSITLNGKAVRAKEVRSSIEKLWSDGKSKRGEAAIEKATEQLNELLGKKESAAAAPVTVELQPTPTKAATPTVTTKEDAAAGKATKVSDSNSAFEVFENEGDFKVTTKTYKGREIGNFVYPFLDSKQKKEYDKIRDQVAAFVNTKEEAEQNLKLLQAFESENKEAFVEAKKAIDAIPPQKEAVSKEEAKAAYIKAQEILGNRPKAKEEAHPKKTQEPTKATTPAKAFVSKLNSQKVTPATIPDSQKQLLDRYNIDGNGIVFKDGEWVAGEQAQPQKADAKQPASAANKPAPKAATKPAPKSKEAVTEEVPSGAVDVGQGKAEGKPAIQLVSDNDIARAEQGYAKAKDKLSKSEDAIAKENARQTDMFGATQKGMFAFDRQQALAALEPLRKAASEAKRNLDKLKDRKKVQDETQQGLFDEKEKSEKAVKEINAKKLTHISGLGMGAKEAKGMYISTEDGNRYERQKGEAKIVTVKIKNPKVSNYIENTELQHEMLQELLDGNQISIGDIAPEFAAEILAKYKKKYNEVTNKEVSDWYASNVKGINEDYFELSAREKAAQLITDKYVSEGYDSLYLPETENTEGQLIVFNRNDVVFKEDKAFTMNSLKRSDAKKTYQEVNKIDDPTEADGLALQYLAKGGKVSEQSINDVAGTTKRASLNTGTKEAKTGEVKARDYADKNAKSIKAIAHSIWDNLPEYLQDKISDTDIRNSLESVINSFNTRLDAATSFVERYSSDDLERREQERYEAEYEYQIAKEEKEINDWLQSEGEKMLPMLADEEYINKLIEQYENETTDKQLAGKTEKGISAEVSSVKAYQKAAEPKGGDTVTVVSKTDKKGIEYYYKTDGGWHFRDSRGKEQRESPAAQSRVTDEWKVAQGEVRLDKAKAVPTDEGNVDATQYVRQARTVLNALFPDVRFEVYDTQKEYEEATGETTSRGVHFPNQKRVALNLEGMRRTNVSKTAIHEVIHPIVQEAANTDEYTLSNLWAQIAELGDVKGMDKVWAHVANYSAAEQANEGVTEFLTRVVDGSIDPTAVPKSFADKIVDLINKIFDALGIDIQISNPTDLRRLSDAIKTAFETGDTAAIEKAIGRKTERQTQGSMELSFGDMTKEILRDIDAFNKWVSDNAAAFPDIAADELVDAIAEDIPGAAATDAQREALRERINKVLDSINKKEAKPEVKKIPKAEGVETKADADRLVGIKHASTAEVRERYHLPEYERKGKTDAEVDAEADQLIADGINVNDILADMRKGIVPSPAEINVVKRYIAFLDDKLSKEPTNENLQNLSNAVQAADVTGTLQSQQFRARQGLRRSDDSLASFLLRQKEESKQDKLTEWQFEQNKKEFEALKAKNEELTKKLAQLEEEAIKKQAQENVNAAKQNKKKGDRKTNEDFKKDRQSIIDNIKKKLAKARGEMNVTPIPYANELIAIAPDVAKLMASYVEQGVVELADIVKKVYADLKPAVNELTENDVRDIIGGKYSEPKKTRRESAVRLAQLKTEAKLLTQIEELEAGKEPTSELKKQERNQKLYELRQKIKSYPLQQLADAKKRIKSEIAKLEEQLASKDPDVFAEKEKKVIVLDEEAKKLKRELVSLQTMREIRLMQDKYAKRSKKEKVKDFFIEMFNVPRSIMASIDLSAPLRQAVIATISHPVYAKNAAKAMFKATASQDYFDEWFFDIQNDPRYELVQEVKLGLADPHSPFLVAKEEAFMSGYVEKAEGYIGRKLFNARGFGLVKSSERAYVMYLNKMRWDLFMRFVERFESNEKFYENEPELYKEAAKYVNNITGRGSLGRIEAHAPILNVAFFSPRLIASRFNLLVKYPMTLYKMPKEIRNEYLKDMGLFIAMGASVVGAYALYGATMSDDDEDKITVEFDPRSADFMKIKQGNTRFDVWGGFQPYVRFLAQFATGEKKSTTTDEITELDGEGVFGEDRGSITTRFIRAKLSPILASTTNLMVGRDMIGQKTSLKDEIMKSIVPLSIGGMVDSYKELGSIAFGTSVVASTFGIGVQTYTQREKEVTGNFMYDGVTIKLNEDYKAKFQESVNAETDKLIEKLKKLPEYKTGSKLEKNEMETIAKDAALSSAKDKFIKQNKAYLKQEKKKVPKKDTDTKDDIMKKLKD